jgi:hypothetical protein
LEKIGGIHSAPPLFTDMKCIKCKSEDCEFESKEDQFRILGMLAMVMIFYVACATGYLTGVTLGKDENWLAFFFFMLGLYGSIILISNRTKQINNEHYKLINKKILMSKTKDLIKESELQVLLDLRKDQFASLIQAKLDQKNIKAKKNKDKADKEFVKNVKKHIEAVEETIKFLDNLIKKH